MEGARVEATVSQELAEAVGEAVASGDYGSAAEVVRDALRDWRHRRLARAMATARMRAAWAEGLDAAAVKARAPREGWDEAFAASEDAEFAREDGERRW